MNLFNFKLTANCYFLVEVDRHAVIIYRGGELSEGTYRCVEGTNTDPGNPNTLEIKESGRDYYEITVEEFGGKSTARIGNTVFNAMKLVYGS